MSSPKTDSRLKEVDSGKIRKVDVMNRVYYEKQRYQIPKDVPAIGRKVVVWESDGSLRGCLVDDLGDLSDDKIFELKETIK